MGISTNRSLLWINMGIGLTWIHMFFATHGHDVTTNDGIHRGLVSTDFVQSFSNSTRKVNSSIVMDDSLPNSIGSHHPSYKQSTKLPEWMKEYFDWHAEQMKGMNETNFDQNKYLILRCTKNERKCGTY
jgi:hypothetical protein